MSHLRINLTVGHSVFYSRDDEGKVEIVYKLYKQRHYGLILRLHYLYCFFVINIKFYKTYPRGIGCGNNGSVALA
ncbi:hypothetical protein ADT41_01325 [Yersinia pestis subsp. microtus bv. Caucasica]|nr:hypothetical protein ADT41_01325 [Yersinia pestis subsp. microtus bv. Caucasica]